MLLEHLYYLHGFEIFVSFATPSKEKFSVDPYIDTI